MPLLLDEVGWFVTDGERYAAYGERGGTVVTSIDTQTGERKSWPIPPGCQETTELPDRAMAAGHLRVVCRTNTYLLDVTGGALRPLDFYPWALGVHWAYTGPFDCAPPTTDGHTFVNWRTGARELRCGYDDEANLFDLDDPQLGPICPYATVGLRSRYYDRVFERGTLVRSIQSGAGEWLSVVRCGRRARKIFPHAASASLSAGLVVWPAGEDRGYAYRIRSGKRRVWRVPPVHNKTAQDYGALHSLLGTRTMVFARRPVQQSCDKVCAYLSWRVWAARAPR